MKYITLFETSEAYNAAILDLPNVSLIEETMSVGYKPYVPETRLVCKYNVTDTSNPTVLRSRFEQNIFKSMEIDGVMINELVTEYTFGTTGEHTVKYELYDETKIGNSAPVFYNSNLIECIIPNSVTYICNNAFTGCSGLTSIVIPDSVTYISDAGFSGCSGLTSIVISDSVTSIGGGAFANCSGLTSIVIPDSVIYINWQAFDGCTGLTSVTIGSGVTSIGNYAFENCSSLTSIVSNAKTAPIIGSNAFQNIKTNGILTVPSGSNGYDVWMGTDNYYLGKYNWTKVEQ